MEVINKKVKLEFIDYIRGFAILYIVAGHTIRFGQYGSEIYNTTLYLFSGGTYLFLFISGFLFQYLLYKFEYINYLKKKFFNVIMPYWITLLPATIIFAFTCNDKTNFLYNKAFVVKMINPLLWGDIINVPLWYIPVITIIFLTSPLLIKLFKNKIIWYSLLLSGLVYIVVGNRFLPEFDCRLPANQGITLIDWNLKYFITVLGRVLVFIPAYMLGMTSCDLMAKHFDYIKNNSRNLSYIFLISWFISYYPLIHVLNLSEGTMTVARFLIIPAIIFFFIHKENKIRDIKWLHKTLKFLAEYSFGIFFIHHYFCNLLFYHCIYRRYDNVWYPYTYKGTLICLFHALGDFVFVLCSSIFLLFLIEKFLIKLGIKNTRMIIGVASVNTSETRTTVRERVIPLLEFFFTKYCPT